jgi:hypothetical protein
MQAALETRFFQKEKNKHRQNDPNKIGSGQSPFRDSGAKEEQAYPSSKQAQAQVYARRLHCHGSPFLTPQYSL